MAPLVVIIVTALVTVALLVGGYFVYSVLALRSLNRDDEAARQRYWRTQYGHDAPKVCI